MACVDSSVWIECLCGRDPALQEQVQALILQDQVMTCGLIEFELLSGARKEELGGLEGQFKKLTYSDMTRHDFRKAAEISKVMKAKGKNLKFMDLGIAAF
jgi:predicted nucleic acid-binding protein